jgi:Uri superfamily endonuclease
MPGIRIWRVRAAGTTAALPARPGTYAVVFRCRGTRTIAVGRLGRLALRAGWYVYVGSAFGPGGLAARVGRHLRSEKTVRWHVDYLGVAAPPVAVWTSLDPARHEHNWAARLLSFSGASAPLPGFGASDCRCPAHLVYFRRRPDPRRIWAEWSPRSANGEIRLPSRSAGTMLLPGRRG